jgi:acetolactate decarboxylase
MRELNTMISDGLWEAVHAHAHATGEPLRHIIASALARHLDIAHKTLFQVSTSSALVEGVYQGAVSVGLLRRHGNLGLGTFEGLDGEMVVVDGEFQQVRSDGSVHAVADNVLTPFAVVTDFQPDETVVLDECPDLVSLTERFDQLRDSANVFYALRVDGRFDRVHTRAMCKTQEGVPLAQAAATQPEFEFANIAGTLVGFWSPEYAKAFNVPGYHLHFLSADRRRGGHLLQCSGKSLRLQIQREANINVAFPETEDFLRANLSKDPTAALTFAERERK